MANIFQKLLAQIRRKDIRTSYISAPYKKVEEQKQVIPQVGKSVINKSERTRTKVEREDFLLSQIDEFREKAKQLQDLMASKESKAQELQSLVSEREDKAEQLAQILTERQEEADLIMKDFNKKVDELSEKVTNKMTDIEASISSQVSEVKNASMAPEQLISKLMYSFPRG